MSTCIPGFRAGVVLERRLSHVWYMLGVPGVLLQGLGDVVRGGGAQQQQQGDDGEATTQCAGPPQNQVVTAQQEAQEMVRRRGDTGGGPSKGCVAGE